MAPRGIEPVEAHDVGSLLHIDFLDNAFAEHGMTHAAALAESHIGTHTRDPLIVGRIRGACSLERGLIGLVGKHQALRVDIEQKPRRIARRALMREAFGLGKVQAIFGARAVAAQRRARRGKCAPAPAPRPTARRG